MCVSPTRTKPSPRTEQWPDKEHAFPTRNRFALSPQGPPCSASIRATSEMCRSGPRRDTSCDTSCGRRVGSEGRVPGAPEREDVTILVAFFEGDSIVGTIKKNDKNDSIVSMFVDSISNIIYIYFLNVMFYVLLFPQGNCESYTCFKMRVDDGQQLPYATMMGDSFGEHLTCPDRTTSSSRPYKIASLHLVASLVSATNLVILKIKKNRNAKKGS